MSTAVAKRVRLATMCLALAIVGSACAGAPPVLKVGLVAPFEGRHRFVGYDVIYSARLAIRQANEGGRLGRYRVALVSLDDGGTEDGAAMAAETLVADSAVVGVVGHGLPATSAAVTPIYDAAGVPFIALPSPGLGTVPPESLPATFRAAYTGVTPFGEEPGPYAASAYDALTLLLAAIAETSEAGRTPTRENLVSTLTNFSVRGITGQMVPGN